jgi:hypothetical protein
MRRLRALEQSNGLGQADYYEMIWHLQDAKSDPDRQIVPSPGLRLSLYRCI